MGPCLLGTTSTVRPALEGVLENVDARLGALLKTELVPVPVLPALLEGAAE